MAGENEIALTFDDGPDKRYTEKLLDVLKENDIQAMFL
ncbi:polysaccharide deacetylase family protein [Clostridioides difficile]|nr:polysaccharide deacetylase family protein [Clostridioides difficile]